MKKLLLVLMLGLSFVTLMGQTDIAEIDANFREAKVGNLNVRYFDALAAPFELSGFPWREAGQTLYRIPRSFSDKEVSKGVLWLANHTAGGQVRFLTDSPYMVLRAEIHAGSDMNHMPRTGSAGFDVFVNSGTDAEQHLRNVAPSAAAVQGKEPVELLVFNGQKQLREITVFLPLYSGVKQLEIGLAPGAELKAPRKRKIERPILFYGSSITQGGCASRPGNNYTAMLCRELDAPEINLGFSGNAKGEIAMAEAIGSLELAAFVMDYDYNAPTAEHLKNTHEPFFKKVRELQPNLPIVLLSSIRPKNADSDSRNAVVKTTYDNAIAAGDKNVYFIDGRTLFGDVPRKYVTVDGTHPTDLGFYLMFRSVLPVLKQSMKL